MVPRHVPEGNGWATHPRVVRRHQFLYGSSRHAFTRAAGASRARQPSFPTKASMVRAVLDPATMSPTPRLNVSITHLRGSPCQAVPAHITRRWPALDLCCAHNVYPDPLNGLSQRRVGDDNHSATDSSHCSHHRLNLATWSIARPTASVAMGVATGTDFPLRCSIFPGLRWGGALECSRTDHSIGWSTGIGGEYCSERTEKLQVSRARPSSSAPDGEFSAVNLRDDSQRLGRDAPFSVSAGIRCEPPVN